MISNRKYERKFGTVVFNRDALIEIFSLLKKNSERAKIEIGRSTCESEEEIRSIPITNLSSISTNMYEEEGSFYLYIYPASVSMSSFGAKPDLLFTQIGEIISELKQTRKYKIISTAMLSIFIL